MPSVSELCIIAGASQGTLEYAFLERSNMGFKEYLKKVCLNYIRKNLLESNSGSVKILDVAHRFGFWLLGRLGSEFEKMFGELPSQTLFRVK